MRSYLCDEHGVSLFNVRDEQLRKSIGVTIGRYHASLFDEVPPIQRVAPERHKEVSVILVRVAQRKRDEQ